MRPGTISDVYDDDDARLIAAAPDLLAELEGWLPIVERQLASIPPCPESKAWQFAKERVQRTRDVIAKAKGAAT